MRFRADRLLRVALVGETLLLLYLGGVLVNYRLHQGRTVVEKWEGGEAVLSVYFSPSPRPREALLKLLKTAKRSVDVAMYTFTDEVLAEELVRIHRRGVLVRVFLDPSSTKYAPYRLLLDAGVPVRVGKSSSGLMHNKFVVVDGTVVATGSYNWTNSARKRNDENLVVIRSKSLAEAYEEEFNYLWRTSYIN